MRNVIILTDLDRNTGRLYPLGIGIIKVFSNLKKAHQYIRKEFPETKVSYSKLASYVAIERFISLDKSRLGILKMSVE